MEKFMRRLAILLAGCLSASAGSQAWAADHVTVATDWSPHGMVSGLLLAKQNGAFAAAGLDVDVLDGKGSTTTVQQVAAGQLDIGFGQLSSMAAAVANAIPVTSIMGLVQAGDNGLMIPADSGWKTLNELKGKRIAVAAGAASTTFFDAFLKGGTSLVVLRQKTRRLFLLNLLTQYGHLGSILAIATIKR